MPPAPPCALSINRADREAVPAAFRRPAAIADARLGDQQLGMVGPCLDLLAQLTDIDAQILRVGMGIEPDVLQQVAMGQHLAGVNDELRQHVVFARRQPHLGVADAHDAAHQIDAQAAAAKLGGHSRLLQAMAQGGADPRQQLRRAEGLGDVVIGAAIQRRHLGCLLAARGQHHDRHRAEAAQRAQRVQPVLIRQTEIEQHQIGRAPPHFLQSVSGGHGLVDHVTLRRQRCVEQPLDRRLVVDHEDAIGAHVRTPPSAARGTPHRCDRRGWPR